MYSGNGFGDSSRPAPYKRGWGPKALERRGQSTQQQSLLEGEWRTVEDNIQDCYKVWNRRRRAYSFCNVALILVALMLSTFVIPLASLFEQSSISLIGGLAITGIIGLQKAFAIGEKAQFYGQIVCELWGVEQESKEAKLDDVDGPKELKNVESELRELIERDARKVPTGQGLAAIQQASQTS